MTARRDPVTIGGCTLLHGDCLDLVPGLPDRADLLLTDPPYRLVSGGNSTGEMAGIFARGRYDNSGELFDIVEWSDMAGPFFAALADDADAIVMTSDREEGDARAAFLGAGFRFHRLLVWDKVTATPNRWFMPNCEFALYLWKGKARTISDPAAKQLIRCPHRDETDHPTEKPVALMQSWIENCSAPGALVLDPFAGSGSVLIAAMRSGRRAIGIEKSAEFFDIAAARMRREWAGFQFNMIAGAAL